jgi:hypothetical protein
MNTSLAFPDRKPDGPPFSKGEIRLVFDGRKVISLWNMLVISAGESFAVCNSLLTPVAVPGDQWNEQAIEKLRTAIDEIKKFCTRMQLPHATKRLTLFTENILGTSDCSRQVIEAEFENLWETIRDELHQRRLAFIPPEKERFILDHKDAFSHAALMSEFALAFDEIQAAEDCFMVGLNPATVFHLMRVAEFGLRRIAKKLHVKLPKNRRIEYASWREALQEIEKKLQAIKGKKVMTEKRRQFYGGLALEITAFQHLWRNPVSHLRQQYGESDAQNAYIHVGNFIDRLAKGVKKGN